MTEEQLIRGVDLLLYGMGTVVVFLSILVALTSVMSRLITKYFPAAEAPMTPRIAGDSAPISALTLRILQAAVDLHRR